MKLYLASFIKYDIPPKLSGLSRNAKVSVRIS